MAGDRDIDDPGRARIARAILDGQRTLSEAGQWWPAARRCFSNCPSRCARRIEHGREFASAWRRLHQNASTHDAFLASTVRHGPSSPSSLSSQVTTKPDRRNRSPAPHSTSSPRGSRREPYVSRTRLAYCSRVSALGDRRTMEPLYRPVRVRRRRGNVCAQKSDQTTEGRRRNAVRSA